MCKRPPTTLYRSAIRTMSRFAILLCCVTCPVVADDHYAAVQPLLRRYCVECHGAKKQKGEIRFDRSESLDSATFEAVYEQLSNHLMPPDDHPQPSPLERQQFMRHVLEIAKADADTAPAGLRRLNRREYENTVRDLLGLHKGTLNPSEYIYEDEVDEGFDTSAESLVISSELLMEYMQAADRSLRHALFTGESSRPDSRVIDVRVNRMKGIGGSRYIGHGKNHVICRCGGRAMVYDGSAARTMRIPGRYTITVTAAAVDRDQYPVRFTPASGAVIMGFGVRQDVTASLSSKPRLLRKFELKDHVDQTFQFDVWIDRDHFPYFSFVNGPSKPITQVRAGIRRGQLDRSEADKRYRGPGVRISRFRVEGPFLDEWPPESIRTTYDSDRIPDLADSAVRKDVVTRFASRAFRRKVTEDEVTPYLEYLDRQKANDVSWHEATIKTFASMMSSVDFLYLRQGNGELDSYELASRLSYFLWSTMPDDQLFALAETGKLQEPAVFRAQVLRLLKDHRSARFSNSFATQWLSLDKLGSMPPDGKSKEFRVYYKDNLQPAMLEETRRFFRHVLQENRTVRDFIDSDYSFVNQGLARLYGVNFTGGKDEFQRVRFDPETKRGGLLGHASILTLSANGVETSPVERGVWVLADFLGTPPPPPPKEVPAVTPDLTGAETVRDLLEKHRSDKACMECHRRMDPPGFALEAYDPIGRLRTRYSPKQVISTHGTFRGTQFSDVNGLKEILARELRPFARSLVVRIAEYARGRRLTAADFNTVESILDDTAESGFRLKDIVTAIAVSDLITRR